MILTDRTFSQKLERTEARANADFVSTRARLDPASGAVWMDLDGTYAMFDGAESPLTQTFGLGIFANATADHLERLETFFEERNAPVFHEVSPLASAELVNLLSERGYRPVELSMVMYCELGSVDSLSKPRQPRMTTRVISPEETDLWARTSAKGWQTEDEGLADFMFNFGRISAQCEGAFPYLAELNGDPIATGMLFIYDDVAMLAGASTVPEGRRKGAQSALLEDRLRMAAQKGCTLAIMAAAPGSQSQLNAQKNGFQIAYTRAKWHLPA